MQKTKSFFIPTLIIFTATILLADNPILSYIIAWLGSFLIFYLTWFSTAAKQTLYQGSVSSQIMRPLFLLQIIFAGFMCCTSIFYFLDHLGYEYLEKISTGTFYVNEQTYLIAKCQRLSLLAHIALVGGILSKPTKFHKIRFDFISSNNGTYNLWLKLSVVFYIVSILFNLLPGLNQFSIYLNNVAIFSASLVLLKGIILKKPLLTIYGGTFFIANFISSTLTGYKEHILVNVIILFALFLPYYKKAILILSLPTIYILLYILPTYATVIRQQAWTGDKTAEEARADAFQTLLQDSNDEEIVETNWQFLANRLSEIGMFTKFVENVPSEHSFYDFEIVENSLAALIPRVIYPNKPITEEVAMERVYQANIVSRNSTVSAKTRPVVDGYLSYGYLGVFVSMFILGYCIQFFNNTAERWFGGYEFGCIVMFNGCFQSLWRGNNFEFMINNMVYGFLTMWIIFLVLRKTQILKPIN